MSVMVLWHEFQPTNEPGRITQYRRVAPSGHYLQGKCRSKKVYRQSDRIGRETFCQSWFCGFGLQPVASIKVSGCRVMYLDCSCHSEKTRASGGAISLARSVSGLAL